MRMGMVLLAAALCGCATSEPIQNVSNAAVTVRGGKALLLSEVAGAIQRAGKSLGWQLTSEGPGLFTGRLALRNHLAVIAIEHGTAAYSIRYRDSTNLDAQDGRIHKAYNQWIESLDRAIRAQLGML